MKTIILAAGKSTRLLPLTKTTHQCLIEVHNRTMLEWQLGALSAAGIQNIALVCGYFGEEVEKKCNELGIKVFFNPFYEFSGIALTLWVVKEELKDGFISIYSDILFDSKIVSSMAEMGGDICLAIKKGKVRAEGDKVIEKEGLIKNIVCQVDKGCLPGENAEWIGIAKVSRRGAEKVIMALEYIARTNIEGSLNETIKYLIEAGEIISSYDIGNARFWDINHPEDIQLAEKLFNE